MMKVFQIVLLSSFLSPAVAGSVKGVQQASRSLASTKYQCVNKDGITGLQNKDSEFKVGNTASPPAALTDLSLFNQKIECKISVLNAKTDDTTDLKAKFDVYLRTNAIKYDATAKANVVDTSVKSLVGKKSISPSTGTSANKYGTEVDFTYTGAQDNFFIYGKATHENLAQACSVKVVCDCFFDKTFAVVTKEVEKAPADCFSADGVVDVLGKGPVTMDQISAGDRVLTDVGTYEPLLGFLHRDLDATRDFLRFYFEGEEKPLEVTAKHMLYKYSKAHPVPADSLDLGDILVGPSGAKRIVMIATEEKTGLFAPMTASGHIVVDGVTASNYATLQDGSEYAVLKNGVSLGIPQHTGIHIFASPMRMLCMTGFDSLCNSVNDNGMLNWVETGIKFAKFADEQNVFVQLCLLFTVLALFLPFYVLELAFGSSALLVFSTLFVAASLRGQFSVQANRVKSA